MHVLNRISTLAAPFVRVCQQRGVRATLWRNTCRQQSGLSPILRYFKRPDARKLKLQDAVSEQYELIYRNTMYRYFVSAQFLSTGLGLIAVVVLPLIYANEDHTKGLYDEQGMRAAPEKVDALIMSSVLIVTCVVLQLMLRKSPIRIYTDPKKGHYVTVFYGSIPLNKYKVPFSVGDIVQVEEKGILPWKDCVYSLKNYAQNLILVPTYFSKPVDLSVMLGYQQYFTELDDDEDDFYK